MSESESKSTGLIYQQIPAIMAKVGAVERGEYNAGQQYKFRSIDAVMNAMAGPLAEYKVFSVPEVTDSSVERYTSNGKGRCHVVLTVRYTFYASDGSSVQVVVVGEAIDTSDKASNKAMAAAYKYALCQLFCIRTLAGRDADNDTHDAPAGTAQSAEQFLADKAAARPASSPAITADVAAFRAACDALALRDLPTGLALSAADYQQIGVAASGMSHARNTTDTTSWLQSQGALKAVTNGDGTVSGFEVLTVDAEGA